MDLTDCPVLELPVWDEEAVHVALDWALERGLIDDPAEWNYFLLPRKDLRPTFFRLAFLENAGTREQAWTVWSEYITGRHQAANDATYAPRRIADARSTYAHLYDQFHRFGSPAHSQAFIIGYGDWLHEHESDMSYQVDEPEENPGFGLSMGQYQAQRLEQVVGGMTASIFPEVEHKLLSDAEYQEAIEEIAAHKNMEKYHSLMDFLFCELHPEWRARCFAFYKRQGPPLREVLKPAQVKFYSASMGVALEVAKVTWRQKLARTWSAFLRIVQELVA